METYEEQALHGRQAEFAAKFRLTLEEYLKIVRTCNATEVVAILELMKTEKHRSSFRQRMHLQVRRWLDNNMSGHPLTDNQFKALVPKWPVSWSLPR